MTTQSRSPVAVVTGGRQGLGRGAALALAAAGFDIVIVDIESDAKSTEVVAAIHSQGRRANFVRGDIADLAGMDALVESIWSSFGAVDCLVNNAGVAARPLRDLLDVSVEAFDRNLNVNLRGTFFLTQRIARRMLGAPSLPGQHRCVVVVTSIAAGIVSTNRGEYCMSKAALSMMAKLFATRLAEAGIHVYEIRPGFMRTEMTAGAAADLTMMIESGFTPIRRWGEPRDIGSTVVALATGQLPFTTGQAIFVDGGLHVHRVG